MRRREIKRLNRLSAVYRNLTYLAVAFLSLKSFYESQSPFGCL